MIREGLTCRREAIVRGAAERQGGDEGGGGVGGGWGDCLSAQEQRELEEIEAALGRINRGSYGHCERCGHAIGWHRLRAVPEGRHCPSCTEPTEPLPR